MAYEYKGWFLGFTLELPNGKKQYWCQLSREDVNAILSCGDRVGATKYVRDVKNVSLFDAVRIVDAVFAISQGTRSV